MKALRSFRLRAALASGLGTLAIVAVLGASLHEWLRQDLLGNVDELLETQASIIVATPVRPIVWHEVERRLELGGRDTTLFVWMERPQRSFWSESWPPNVSPFDVLPTLAMPDDWRDRCTGPGRGGGPPEGGPRDGRPDPGLIDGRDPVRLAANARLAQDPGRYYAAFTDEDVTLILGASLAPVRDSLARFRMALFLATPLALFASMALGMAVADRSMRSIRSLAERVETINAAGLDQRLDSEGADEEFARLIAVFNELLRRLETSFHEARRFADNAAHELRTPLTILIGKLDAAIQSEAPGSERQQFLVELLDEAARLKGIADRLLLLARSDAGRLDLYPEKVNLSELLEGLVEDAQIVRGDLEFRADIPPGIELVCDRSLATQILHNLLSNAMKYNRAEGGRVELKLRARDAHVEFSIGNTGPRIPDDLASRIFERFYRGDKSHSRRVEGTGLGLALARQIARAHGGELALERSDEKGSVFKLRLPFSPISSSGTNIRRTA